MYNSADSLQGFTVANFGSLAVPICWTRCIANDIWLKHDNSAHVVAVWTTLEWNMIIGLVPFSIGSLLSIQNTAHQAQKPPAPTASSGPPRRHAALLDSKCRSSQRRRFFSPSPIGNLLRIHSRYGRSAAVACRAPIVKSFYVRLRYRHCVCMKR